MKNIRFILIALFFVVSLNSCQKEANSSPDVSSVTSSKQFADYWYAGVAEIDAYNLEQARYGEIHDGKAVLIFVTEPFSKSKQVKMDDPKANADDEQTVLKLNFTKKFNTGIYPYSMMLSAFTPVQIGQFPNTPKVTMSSQEWCGHVYAQLNLNKNNYDLKSFSYFEQEGDVNLSVKKAWLEDEIWNRIRLDYKSLPTGEVAILPGLFHTRLLHKNFEAKQANATLVESDSLASYTLDYPSEIRQLTIHFETIFPYKITGWEESITGLNGKVLKPLPP